MVKAMTAELAAMGIPFFSTRLSLVARQAEGEPQSRVTCTEKQITEPDLLKLQRKMLCHLEELYGD